MTVTTSTNKTQPLGNGVTTSFPYAFRIFAASDLVVVSTVIATGVDTPLVLGTDYTVTGAGSYNGGNVVFGVAPATGVRLTIRRVVSITQQTDLRNNGAYFAETHEDVFDRLTMVDQQLGEQFSRALRQPASDAMVIGELPGSALRASKILGFDSAGNLAVVTPADQSASALALLLASITGAAQIGVAAGGTVQTALNAFEARATVAGHATAADIWGAAGHSINLTGVITYTNFPAAPQAGAKRRLYPATGAVFTNGGAFGVVGNANYTVPAGSSVDVEAITTTTFRLVPLNADGTAIVGTVDASTSVKGKVQLATGVEAIAGTDALKALTPATLRSAITAPGTAPMYAARAWVNFNGTGTVAINASGNVSSITDNGVGDYTANFTTAMTDANYSVSGTTDLSGTFGRGISIHTVSAASLRFIVWDGTNTRIDQAIVTAIITR